MDYQAIIAGTVGKENTYGTIVGRVRETPFTYCRISPDDLHGRVRGYLGEGQVTDDALRTFGGYGVVHIDRLQTLLAYICEQGFEHHVAINPARCASILQEGLSKYMGWDLYYHAEKGNVG
jgi:L-fucose isomerase-like protein